MSATINQNQFGGFSVKYGARMYTGFTSLEYALHFATVMGFPIATEGAEGG